MYLCRKVRTQFDYIIHLNSNSDLLESTSVPTEKGILSDLQFDDKRLEEFKRKLLKKT